MTACTAWACARNGQGVVRKLRPHGDSFAARARSASKRDRVNCWMGHVRRADFAAGDMSEGLTGGTHGRSCRPAIRCGCSLVVKLLSSKEVSSVRFCPAAPATLTKTHSAAATRHELADFATRPADQPRASAKEAMISSEDSAPMERRSNSGSSPAAASCSRPSGLVTKS